jgi:hypothetical protein
MATKEKETAAEEYIRRRRMRYAEMYPTDFHLLLRLLSTDDDNWNDEGIIVCTYKEELEPTQLTEEGWKSFENVMRCPTHWPEPSASSPILNIPDNAEMSWLNAIDSFAFQLEGWKQEHVETWIATAARLAGMGETYQASAIQRNTRGYHAVCKAMTEGKIRDRIRLIMCDRMMPKVPKSPTVEAGATVRFHCGVDEALVESIATIPGSRYERNAGKKTLVTLDKEINGSRTHLVENLVATQFPKDKPQG